MKRLLACILILGLSGIITVDAEEPPIVRSSEEPEQNFGVIVPPRKGREVHEGTNVTLTVDSSGLGQPANAEEFNKVKYYWNAGLVVTAWTAETPESKVDAASARIETNKDQIVLSYAMQSITWPKGAPFAAIAIPVQLEFVVHNIARTNLAVTVKRRE